MNAGIVILDKPSGLGSNAALSRLKRLLGEPKMGFLGTLDPLASGVLPVFLGKATRLIPLFEGLPKTYRVTLKLGERTDTFDALGKVVERRELGDLTEARVREAILSQAGRQRQTAPAYSAIKVQGVPAYKLARRGAPVPERVREVELWDLAVDDVRLPEATLRLTCSAGTYVRSLVEALGLALGPGAHVTALRRLACGSLFTLRDSVTLKSLEQSGKQEQEGWVKNPAAFLPEFAPLIVTPETEFQLRDGKTIPLEPAAQPQLDRATRDGGAGGWTSGQRVKALGPLGNLIAIGEIVPVTAGQLGFRPTRVLI
jgi:tRNA pseudouridine55 synthase